MSERLSNKEVEDVLSSVRRLVSKQAGSAADAGGVEGDHRPDPSSEAKDVPEPTDVADEKLLLTPAFRVEDQCAAPNVEAEHAPVPDTAPAPVTVPEPDAETGVEPAIETMKADDEALATASGQAKGSVWSLEERIAELEAAVGGHVDEWEPDGSEDVTAEVPTSFPMPATEPDVEEAQHTDEASEPDTSDHGQDSAEEFAEPDTVAETTEPVAAEAENEATVAADVPQEAPYVDMPGSNIVFAHNASEDHQTETKTDDAEAVPEDGSTTIELDDLTEEMLRDLVADIVRDELQGALGERITRNVRKLVRREIQRALATGRIE